MAKQARRDLLRAAAVGVAGVALGRGRPAVAAAPLIDRRTLTGLGVEVGVLACGLGSQFVGPYQRAAEEDKERVAEERRGLLRRALELGCNYWDTAESYGPSQQIIGPLLKDVRDQVFMVSKTGARDYDGYLRALEKVLGELQTDHLDLFHCHDMQPRNVTDEGLAAMEAGCVRAARKAKEDGLIRHWGVTGHSSAACLLTFIDKFAPEAVMSVFSAGHQDRSYVEALLPVARERGLAVIAMKTHRQAAQTDLAGGDLVRYALSLEGICAANVGLDSLGHLDENTAVARGFEPLTATQIAWVDGLAARQLEGVTAIWQTPQYRDAVV